MNYQTNELTNYIINGTVLKELVNTTNYKVFCTSINFIVNLLDELNILTVNYIDIEYLNLYNYLKEYLDN